ncbi:T9SS type A sorting domain-containing protein [Flavobacterium caeni]|uniref:Por secretion system C-terminal sorting domain-containing protein n=1 Tax=Flavobacterium caeni TaxID=490189 RepID=A0A1G5JFR3_9FLAO|nr:T9SS type A sorting domain-containing protein [Flavobacterium caeni]SCY87223.1 Por secretion system C-terminal sorting domain-containing protein [Flavobacterium caeni]
MKTKLLSLLIALCGTLGYAQLEPVTDESFGTFTPLFQYQGNLFVRQNIDDLETQGYDYQYYKINIATNAVTQMSVTDSAKPYFENGYWAPVINNGPLNPAFNPQFYGNTVYFSIFVGNQIIVKINTQANVIDIFDPGEIQSLGGVQLVNDRLYFGNGGNDNYAYNGWIDLSDNAIYYQPYPMAFDVANSYAYSGGLFMSVRMPGDDIIGYDNYETVWAFYNLNDAPFPIVPVLPEDEYGAFILPQGFYPKGKPIVINNRLVYNSGYGGKIISFNADDVLDRNFNILNLSDYSLQDYIVLNDGAIFYTYHYDVETATYSYKWYKTNGINTAVEINYMPTISQWGFLAYFQTYSNWNSFQPASTGNSFVQVGNTTYFSTVDNQTGMGGNYTAKVYKMTSINSTPELIYTSSEVGNYDVKFATEWQGNLVFYSEVENAIYTYNGTELYIDPQLNNFNAGGRSIQENNVEVTGIFKTDNDYLLVNTAQDGLFKIENNLSVAEQKEKPSKVELYPNPVSETLYFSEPLTDIEVFDMTGRLQSTSKKHIAGLNVGNLPAGEYILKAKTGSGKENTIKFIKK